MSKVWDKALDMKKLSAAKAALSLSISLYLQFYFLKRIKNGSLQKEIPSLRNNLINKRVN